MNHFPWIQVGQELLPNWFPLVTHANTPEFIWQHVEAFQRGYNITPNWLNLDFIDIGGGITSTRKCNDALHKRGITESVKIAAGRFIYKKVFEQPTADGEPAIDGKPCSIDHEPSQIHKVRKHDKVKRGSDDKPTQIDSTQDGTKDRPKNVQPRSVKYSHG